MEINQNYFLGIPRYGHSSDITVLKSNRVPKQMKVKVGEIKDK